MLHLVTTGQCKGLSYTLDPGQHVSVKQPQALQGGLKFAVAILVECIAFFDDSPDMFR